VIGDSVFYAGKVKRSLDRGDNRAAAGIVAALACAFDAYGLAGSAFEMHGPRCSATSQAPGRRESAKLTVRRRALESLAHEFEQRIADAMRDAAWIWPSTIKGLIRLPLSCATA